MSRVGDPDVAIWFGMLVFKMHVWGCCGCCVGSSVLIFAPWSSTARDFSIGWLPEASLAWPSWCAHFRSCWWSSKACTWFWCCHFNLITWVLLEVLKLCWISQWSLWISLPCWERERERECVTVRRFVSHIFRKAGQASLQLQGLLHGLQFFWPWDSIWLAANKPCF